MTADQPRQPVLVVADKVTVLPMAPKKEWEERQRPEGLWFYLTLFGAIVAREVRALATGETTWTVSAILWWSAGPRWEPRWWLVYVGVVVPFLLWLIAHIGAREFVQGRELVAALVLGLAFALAGIALNR